MEFHGAGIDEEHGTGIAADTDQCLFPVAEDNMRGDSMKALVGKFPQQFRANFPEPVLVHDTGTEYAYLDPHEADVVPREVTDTRVFRVEFYMACGQCR